MSWIQRLFGIKEKTKAQKEAEYFFLGQYHQQKMKESPYRNRTVFDMKFGRSYNTGEFHTKMPEE